MNTPARWLVSLGALSLLFVIVGGFLLPRGVYGLTLFVLVPVVVGGLAAWLLGARGNWEAAGLGALVVSIATCSLLLLGMEGIVCVAMAIPLTATLGALGGVLAFQAVQLPAEGRRTLPLLLLLPPATLTWDTQAPKPTFRVRTQIVVAASPEQVWKHVVTFSDLPEPREWYFHTGLAYPKRARIEGSGPGAVRYCEFSTGPFVEPIDVWDEPHLLAFHVTQNPAPLHEWNPFGEIEPKHLHGYLVSKHGQFRLVPLAGGRTLLEGTTWYQHGLWPATFWRWWSDAIIHRIHLRVLQHVQRLAEQDASAIRIDLERRTATGSASFDKHAN